jgi:nitrogenase molybdenum-iron protein alpha chain
MFKEKYGVPWLKINFIGPEAMAQTLRDMAQYFGDEELIERTEEVIEEEMAAIEDKLDEYKEICEGETAVVFVGGSRSHHYQNLFRRIGIEPVVVGYEFGHRDDYEGREIIPEIEETADDQNIPELEVSKDEKKYQLRMSKEKLEDLKEEIPLEQYEGLIKEVKNGNYVIDDYNHHETVNLIEKLDPSLYCSGIKDKYVAHKMGVFSKQLHSYDYKGPYAGFKGAVNFAKDIAVGMNTPAWSYVTPPWKEEAKLEGELGGNLGGMVE